MPLSILIPIRPPAASVICRSCAVVWVLARVVSCAASSDSDSDRGAVSDAAAGPGSVRRSLTPFAIPRGAAANKPIALFSHDGSRCCHCGLEGQSGERMGGDHGPSSVRGHHGPAPVADRRLR